MLALHFISQFVDVKTRS